MPLLPSVGLSAKNTLGKNSFAERHALVKEKHSAKNVFAKR
jgi:hypothetical protein